MGQMLPVRWLLVALAGWLVIDLLLLLPFLGRCDWLALVAAPSCGLLFVAAVARTTRTLTDAVTLRTLGVCALVALTLVLLGGEGRLFYANLDWRVRDAVLNDMALHPWPFAYQARGLPEVLRAPIGMYLIPALVMKAGGQIAGDWVLVAQNGGLVAIVLALGSTLFADTRHRAVALAVFVGLSGMDVVGAWLATGFPIADHLESWAGALQYSSHLTQIFWVPQHALAGWIGAIGFALWRDRGLPLGVFLALVPLTVLWSPLAALGTMPFAILAGLHVLARRRLRLPDLALPAIACVLALPALLYLSADAASVGAYAAPFSSNVYLAFQALEVMPLLFVARWSMRTRTLGAATLALIAAMLLLLPFGQVGTMSDFVMRVSIAPLAMLALAVADSVNAAEGARRGLALAVLAVGAVTGAHEVRRAFVYPPAPRPLCSFYGAWGSSPPAEKSTYLAAVARLPVAIRPARVTLVEKADPPRCWAGRWPVPTGTQWTKRATTSR